LGQNSDRETIERFWAALSREDFDSALSLVHDDFEERYPQSGELIRGRRNFEGLLKSFPGFPSIEHVRTRGGGEVWVSELEFDYGGTMAGQRWQVCEVIEMRDGKLWRIQAFFGQPFEPAEWRAQWAERG
jgi:ketosteroid isomerase-like protein